MKTVGFGVRGAGTARERVPETMKHTKNKLSLNTETLRYLVDPELARIAGGNTDTVGGNTAYCLPTQVPPCTLTTPRCPTYACG
jgi:hypothetical protein